MNIDDFPFHELAVISDTQEDLINRIIEHMADIDAAKKVIRIYVDLEILDPKWLPSDNGHMHYAPYIPLLTTDKIGIVEFTPSEGITSRYGQGINDHFYKRIKIKR